MISFLHRWDYYWKCQLDADVKTESYYHHDGEQLLFYKKVRIKAYRKSGTWDQGVGTRDPYMGRGTRDRYIGRGTRDFSLGTLHLGTIGRTRTRDLYAETTTWDLLSETLYQGPRICDPICGTKVRKPILFIRAQFFVLF